jgi:protein-tyrosine phosphatase
MIVALYLVTRHGLAPEAAISKIRRLRDRSIEVEEQIDAVHEGSDD